MYFINIIISINIIIIIITTIITTIIIILLLLLLLYYYYYYYYYRSPERLDRCSTLPRIKCDLHDAL